MLTRNAQRRGFTLIELLVVISIIALLIGILLPSLGQARLSAMRVKCQANAKGITTACLSYAADNNNKNVPDERVPAYALVGGVRTLVGGTGELPEIDTEQHRKDSWFGQIESSYLGGDRAAVKCPVIDDHRQGGVRDPLTDLPAWFSDYNICRFGINTSIDIAEEPVRNVMFMEPNMKRGPITAIPLVVAGRNWYMRADGTYYRGDLEQLKAGSLSYGFVDGHAFRVTVRDIHPTFIQEFPELALSAGSPPANIAVGALNYYWWSSQQVDTPLTAPRAKLPIANDSLKQ